MVLLVMAPLISWVAWIYWPSHLLRVLIVDKTSSTPAGNERRSFNWILTYDKHLKPGGSEYSVKNDFRGFHPITQKQFALNGLEQISESRIDSLATRYDMVYFTDTYGVYWNDWSTMERPADQPPLLYGGLQRQDLLFLQSMKKERKLILTEFNFFASPTRDSVRWAAEQILDIHWTGWVGRYFSSLDTMNDELPRWAIQVYERQQKMLWPFHKSGIVLIHSSDTIVVLENGSHLEKEIPIIITTADAQAQFRVSEEQPYSFWFDITLTGPANEVPAQYVLAVNPTGDSILARYRIPSRFPALIRQKDAHRYYYFAGDFADNPILDNWWAHFKGITWLKSFFYTKEDLSERKRFFWEYYLPMMSSILNEYQGALVKENQL